jgi:hypothetical protein
VKSDFKRADGLLSPALSSRRGEGEVLRDRCSTELKLGVNKTRPHRGMHRNFFGVDHRFSILGLGLFLSLCSLAPKPIERPRPIEPAEGARQARVLIAQMLAARPEESATNTGRLKIRDREGNQSELAVRFELSTAGNKVVSLYEAAGAESRSLVARLTVVHSDNQPNQYELLQGTGSGTRARSLSGKEAMIPFAGSDFWLADLGLEFLHWPQQRILYKDMRHSQSCDVLESRNPDPAANGYARVVSWVDIDAPHGVVHADAYDAADKRVKQFDPKSVKKIQGEYKLEAMEMLDERTGSRSVITFDLRQR